MKNFQMGNNLPAEIIDITRKTIEWEDIFFTEEINVVHFQVRKQMPQLLV